jgi:hypothetical protein
MIRDDTPKWPAGSYGVSEATISRLAAASPFEHGVAVGLG